MSLEFLTSATSVTTRLCVHLQDFSLAHKHYYEIAEVTRERVGDLATRVVLYGHLADGNVHLNITSPAYDKRIQER